MKLIRSLLATIGNWFFKKHAVKIYSETYDDIAPTYDYVLTRQLLAKETEKLIDSLEFHSKMRCLDLGCGTGHGTALIGERIFPDGGIIV